MKLLATLLDEHILIRQLVDALDAAAHRSVDCDVPGPVPELLAALTRALEQVHMAKEDHVLFPYLHERGLTRSTAVVNALLAQHETIADGHRRIAAACERTARGDPSAREALREAIAALVGLLREHLRIEEQYFYELADGVIDAADVEALSARFSELDRRVDARAAWAFAEAVLGRRGTGPGRPTLERPPEASRGG